MPSVSVRYIVNDVDEAISFYCGHRFRVLMHPAPGFAMLASGDLRLALSAPGPGPGGGGRAMSDGTAPRPGGWNRFMIEVSDLEHTVETLRRSGAHFRNDIVTGMGGRQIPSTTRPAIRSSCSSRPGPKPRPAPADDVPHAAGNHRRAEAPRTTPGLRKAQSLPGHTAPLEHVSQSMTRSSTGSGRGE